MIWTTGVHSQRWQNDMKYDANESGDQLCRRLQWRTKELGTVWKSPSKQLLRRTLLLRTIFRSALGSSRRSPTSSSNVVAKKALILTHFAQNSTLFSVGGEGALVLVISLERSQHFWPHIILNFNQCRKLWLKLFSKEFSYLCSRCILVLYLCELPRTRSDTCTFLLL